MIKTTIIDQRPIIRVTLLPQGGYSGGGTGVTDHDLLTGKDKPDQHPNESITPPVNTLGAAPADTAILPIFTTAWLRLTWGNLKAWLKTYFDTLYGAKQIQFYPTEQTTDFTITADMLYKLVYINSATDVNVTVDNMPVGGWIPFDLLGTGLPVFVDGVGDNIFPDEDFTGATSFILIRIEDDGVNEQYDIKYG